MSADRAWSARVTRCKHWLLPWWSMRTLDGGAAQQPLHPALETEEMLPAVIASPVVASPLISCRRSLQRCPRSCHAPWCAPLAAASGTMPHCSRLPSALGSLLEALQSTEQPQGRGSSKLRQQSNPSTQYERLRRSHPMSHWEGRWVSPNDGLHLTARHGLHICIKAVRKSPAHDTQRERGNRGHERS